MIEKIEKMFMLVNKLSTPEFLLKALVWLAILVCLYNFDHDNWIDFRECLKNQEWILASLPLLKLLITLANWLFPVSVIVVALWFFAYYKAFEITWLNTLWGCVLRNALRLSFWIMFIIVAHRVLFDDLIIHGTVFPIDGHWEIWCPIGICFASYIVLAISSTFAARQIKR